MKDRNNQVIPQTKNVHIRFVDTDTAEILFDKYKKFAFGCCADGEKYLQKTMESLLTSIRAGRNVSLTCEVFPFINQTEADLFGCNIEDYPVGVY